MAEDLRKEQTKLLRFEKQLMGLAASLAAGGAIAKSVDGKLHATDAATAHAALQDALVALADATSAAHAAIEARADEAGVRLLNIVAGGGLPKPNASAAVRSILGLG